MPLMMGYTVVVTLIVTVKADDGITERCTVQASGKADSAYGPSIPVAVDAIVEQAARKVAPHAKTVLQNETERLK